MPASKLSDNLSKIDNQAEEDGAGFHARMLLAGFTSI
jgi:hypothetical protein